MELPKKIFDYLVNEHNIKADLVLKQWYKSLKLTKEMGQDKNMLFVVETLAGLLDVDEVKDMRQMKKLLRENIVDRIVESREDIDTIVSSCLHEAEDEKNDDTTSQEVIDDLVNTDWSSDNDAQMKAVQLLKGLALSDEPAANEFMKKIDDFTSGMKK